MTDTRYKIVFRGDLVNGMGTTEVAGNLKQRFKFSEAGIERLFSGKAVVLKSDLDEEAARKYAAALNQAGLRCLVEPMAPPAPALPTMECPKCGQSQPENEICAACGVVIAKYLQRQEQEELEQAGIAPHSQGEPGGEGGPAVTDNILASLAGTKPWARLISVLLFLAAGLGLLGALAMLIVGGAGGGGAPVGMIAVVQILNGALYLIPAYFLFKYASAIGELLSHREVAQLETALACQKSFWKFSGILALVMLVLAGVGILAAILIPSFMS